MNITINRGDTNTFQVTAIRANQVVNLTGAKMWFTVKEHIWDQDDDAVLALNSVDDASQIVSSLPTSGQFQIQLTPADTDTLDRYAYLYDVQVKEADGTVTTVQKGKLYLNKDVTRNAT